MIELFIEYATELFEEYKGAAADQMCMTMDKAGDAYGAWVDKYIIGEEE